MSIDIQASLYTFGLGLIKRENRMYCLVDLSTGEWYEEMTIYYIETLLNNWNQKRVEYIKLCL